MAKRRARIALTNKTNVNHREREAVHQIEPNDAHADARSN